MSSDGSSTVVQTPTSYVLTAKQLLLLFLRVMRRTMRQAKQLLSDFSQSTCTAEGLGRMAVPADRFSMATRRVIKSAPAPIV